MDEAAKRLAKLHIPGKPVVFANVYDGITAAAIFHTNAEAVATASFAIASSLGLDDDDLTLEQNLAAVHVISKVLGGKVPLTVDMQDGYGDQLEEAIKGAIDAGAVGCNIEDAYPNSDALYTVDEASARIRRVQAVAESCGVPHFVINARTDALKKGETLDEAITRGKAFLQAGAEVVFVWGGPERGMSKEEVEQLIKAFDGRLNVKLGSKPDSLSVKELSEMGVSRISVGPSMMHAMVETYKSTARRLLDGGYLAPVQ